MFDQILITSYIEWFGYLHWYAKISLFAFRFYYFHTVEKLDYQSFIIFIYVKQHIGPELFSIYSSNYYLFEYGKLFFSLRKYAYQM